MILNWVAVDTTIYGMSITVDYYVVYKSSNPYGESMIPISLSLNGIYSYQTEQKIDFTQLTSTNLFGIFGPVGSGKSTIIEAISFALYGQTERLNKQDNRNYNMMNLRSNELLIEFIFKARKPGDDEEYEYCFVVNGKRNKRHFEKIRSFVRKAYRKENGKWVPLETTNAEQIIGLSYDNFRRTIIIPQGQFQEFLQLTNTDRTRMMRELFHLEKYEFSDRVAKLKKLNDEKIQEINGKLSQIGEITDEMIKKEESKSIHLENEIKQISSELTEKQKKETQLNALKNLFEKIEKQKSELSKLESKENEYKERESQLRNYEICVMNFKYILDNKKENEKMIKQCEENLKNKRDNFNRIKIQLKQSENKFNEIKEEYESRDALIKKSEELKKIIRIKELDKAINKLDEQIKKEEEFLKDTNIEIENIHKQIKTIAELVKTKKKEVPDLKELAEIRQWFTEKNHLLKMIKTLENEVQKFKREYDSFIDKKFVLLNQEIVSKMFNEIPRNLQIDKIIRILMDKKDDIEMEIELTDNKISHLQIQNKLSEYVSELEQGKPCPLCGSIVHPNILNIENVENQLKIDNEQKQNLKKAFKSISDIVNQLNIISAQINDKENMIQEKNAELANYNKNLQKHIRGFQWQKYQPDDEMAVSNVFNKAEKLKIEIEDMENKKESLEESFNRKKHDKEEYQEKLEKTKQEHTTKKAQRDILFSQITILSYRDFGEMSNEWLHKEITVFLQQYNEIENDYKNAEDELTQLKEQKNRLNGEILSDEKNLLQLHNNQENIDMELNERIKEKNYDNIDTVEKILGWNLNIDKERKEITCFWQNLNEVKVQLEQFERERVGRIYDADFHQQLILDIENMNRTREEKNQQLGNVKGNIERMRQDLQNKFSLEKDKESLENRASDIDTLKKLFRESGFVNYVSSIYLKNLCNSANHRFHKLTRQNLSLELNENNEFQIKDFLNDGRIRNVKTLSGGQTFQAAFSLALALADNIQKLANTNQNFFFLDEGFGTLDNESLQIVLDTLKSLYKENRIVGIISHVDEFQQEIPVYLKVKNDPKKGSIIEKNWE